MQPKAPKVSRILVLSIAILALLQACMSLRNIAEEDFALPADTRLYININLAADTKNQQYKKLLQNIAGKTVPKIAINRTSNIVLGINEKQELSAIINIYFRQKFLLQNIGNSKNWQKEDIDFAGFKQRNGREQLAVPQNRLLVYSQGQIKEMLAQLQGGNKSPYPREFQDLSLTAPVSFYSKGLNLSSLGRNLPVELPAGLVESFWGSIRSSGDNYKLNISINTENAIVAKSMRLLLKLFIAPLLGRSKDPFAKNQLKEYKLSSSANKINLEIKLNDTMLIAMVQSILKEQNLFK